MDLRTYKTLDADEQTELMSQLAEWRSRAESDCEEPLERMQKAQDFYNGDQWDAVLKAQMEDEGKYVGTIPLIRPQVQQMAGNQVGNPKDITALPTRGGMREVADVLAAQLKHAIEANDGVNLMAQWFQRGTITGIGFLAWMRDYTRDPLNGDLVIRLLPEFDCRWDATCKSYDFNGASGGTGGDGAGYFFWDEWVNQDWAERRWPILASSQPATGRSLFGRAYHAITTALYGVVAKSTEALSQRASHKPPDYTAGRYCLQHGWWPEWVEAWYWYDRRRSELEAIILTEAEDIRMAKDLTRASPEVFFMVRGDVKVMHHTLSVGDQFLEDMVDEFDLSRANATQFPVARFCPMYSWDRHAGVVEDMIGPQETLNWLRSSIVNILKLGPNSGWKIGRDVDNYAQILKQSGGQPNMVIELDKCGGSAERIEPPPFPSGLHMVSEQTKLEIREVSNIRTEAPEQDTAEMSGRALLAKQANAQIGVAPSLANFDWSMKIFGRVGLDIIRCSAVYSDDEIKAIVEEARLLDDKMLHEARTLVCEALGVEMPQEPPLPDPARLQGASPQVLSAIQDMYRQEYEAWQGAMAAIDAQARPMAIQALIDATRDAVAGRYHTAVSLAPYGVTARLSRLANLMDTNKLLVESNYPPLPEQEILEASDLPGKERILRQRGYAA